MNCKFHPFQYNPVSRSLQAYKIIASLNLSVRRGTVQTSWSQAKQQRNAGYSRFFANCYAYAALGFTAPRAADLRGSQPSDAGCDYLVITPEPGALALLLMGSVALLRRR